MEAYFQALSKASGASGFLIVRDDAALTTSPNRRKTFGSSQEERLRSWSSKESSASGPCMGPPSLPRRKRSNDDLFAGCKATAARSQEKSAKARVLKSFFGEVLDPTITDAITENPSGDHRMNYINAAVNITNTGKALNSRRSTKASKRWSANPTVSLKHSL